MRTIWFVRSRTSEGHATLLGDLLAVLLAPYDNQGAFAVRIRITVPRMGVGENSATEIALVIHELATNSVKYGALSADAGRPERGGPHVTPPSNPDGFGSGLVSRRIGPQLGGSIAHDWCEEGAVITLKLARGRLAV